MDFLSGLLAVCNAANAVKPLFPLQPGVPPGDHKLFLSQQSFDACSGKNMYSNEASMRACGIDPNSFKWKP
jgi:hypothetical protein